MSLTTAFSIAISGARACEESLAITAQNIAGQHAEAYKRQYPVLLTTAAYDRVIAGTPTSSNETTFTPSGMNLGMGVYIASTYRDFTQGEAINTNRKLDVMIEGEGFFVVTLPDGTNAYTRVGVLDKSANGQLVTAKTGYLVSPGITLPSDAQEITISPQGQILALLPTSRQLQQIGQLELATFVNNNGLRAIEDSMYVETDASGAADIGISGTGKRGNFKQGWKEGSNVSPVEEMTTMMKLQHSYEQSIKILKTGDEMAKSATQMV